MAKISTLFPMSLFNFYKFFGFYVMIIHGSGSGLLIPAGGPGEALTRGRNGMVLRHDGLH